MRTARLLALGWLFHFRMLSQSAFDGFLAILWPLFFATVAFFMFRSGHSVGGLAPVALGAAVMGVWTATSVSASSALQRERRLGTLELLVAAPSNLATMLLSVCLATSTIGLYCIVATLIWARLLFGIHVPVAHPVSFVLGIVGIVVTIGSLGFLMAVAFVRSRRAWALGAVSEYPIWLVCGFLVPIT
jgi:ABC-2 type transport system permease protein